MTLRTPTSTHAAANTMLQHFLTFPHAMASSELDRIVDLMEGTPGYDIRQLSDEILGLYTTLPTVPLLPTLVDPVVYNSLGSLREKVAYLASLDFPPSVNRGYPSQTEIIASIQRVVEHIQCNVLPRIAPSESRIVRSSLLSALPVSLTPVETQSLATIITSIRDYMEQPETGLADFAQTMHLGAATEAQRLAKLQDACHALQQNGLYDNLPEFTRTAITTLDLNTRLKPLTELDAAYRQVGEAFNSVRNGYRHFGHLSGPVHVADVAKVETVLTSLGLNLDTYLTPLAHETGALVHEHQFQDISGALSGIRSKKNA